MNSEERKRRNLKVIILVFAILSLNNIILMIKNYSYAYFEKNIKTGVKLKITTLDKIPIKVGPANDVVKSRVVSNVTDTCNDFTEKGGLVAINTDGTLYQEGSGQEIREYRYVGPDVDNYIYFNCQDNVEPSAETCEIWRILGIFKDEDGNEHLKIVRNEILSGIFPKTFEAEGTTYNIKYSSNDTSVYWNYPTTTNTYKNDWATAGIQYWLNSGIDKETKLASDGYMSYLSKNAKDMIEYTKYYLGNVNPSHSTTINSYIQERGNTQCTLTDDGDKDNCEGGDVLEGNQATWNGNIALMYPSDLGYSNNSCDWTKNLGGSGAIRTSWLPKNGTEWLLSPNPFSTNYGGGATLSYYSNIWVSRVGMVASMSVHQYNAIRPSLNLKSEAMIFQGKGTLEEPFVLKLNN